MLIGYARTGTDTAQLAEQIRALRAAGARLVAIELETGSARPALAECLADLRSGDVLLAATPDRLADTPAELLALEAALTRRGIGLVVLSRHRQKLGLPRRRQQPPARVKQHPCDDGEPHGYARHCGRHI